MLKTPTPMLKNRRLAYAIGLLVLVTSPTGHAQQWSGVIDPSRAAVWSTAGVTGGIPVRSTICATLNPGATAAQINSAIAACPSGQVVKLNAGTYTLSSGLILGRNNVTLRGAGADQTKLIINAGSTGCGVGFIDFAIRVCTNGLNIGGGGIAAARNVANWSAGYAKGTTVIGLSSTNNLVVGSTIFLDQLDDTVTDGVTDGFPGAGDILQCSGGPPCGADGGNAWARVGRVHVELHKVTAINGTNVTVDPPVQSPDFRAAKSPGAWWGNRTASPLDVIEGAGLEDFSIDWTGAGSFTSAIGLINATDCWVKGLAVIRTGPTSSFIMHVFIINGFRDTIRDSYFYGPSTLGATINTNYAYASHVTSSILVENNIYHHNPSPIIPSDPDTGSVFGYNVVVDAWYSGRGPQQHNAGDMYALFEGNNVGQVYNDNNHGTHHFHTYFRNHIDGEARSPNGGSSTDAGFALLTHNRFYNIVGNVIGGPPFTNYQDLGGPGGTSVYSLNWKGNCSNCGSMPTDTNVQRTLFRWGNYDSVTGSTRFLSSEVPSNIANYPQPVPSSQALPPSFYLSAKPAWFGAVPWPPIGPDVSGGPLSNSGGHAYKIPARLCYESTSQTSGILNFNAAACYGTGGGSAPTASTGLLVSP